MSDKDDTIDPPEDGTPVPPGETEPAPAEESRPKVKDKPRRSKAGRSVSAGSTKPDPGSSSKHAKGGAAKVDSTMMTRAAIVGAVALAVGAAGGWFGHDAQAKAKLRAESAPAPSGSGAAAGPCGAWEQKICGTSGDQSAACQQAKAATTLLTPPACEVALESVPATLAKVKAARASCDTLVTKLCNDLPKGSQTCQMVQQRASSFPGERCVEMLKNYDKVIAELKMMDQQNSMQMGGPHGGPPGGPPAGMPPQGAPPH